jgi:hypothetical protein
MHVEFCRTSERGYAVAIHRAGSPPRVMDPAPGYDDDMPHDLLHFIVECELGLIRGIFGQVAAGGTAGTFYAPPAGARTRDAVRQRRRMAKRGERLQRAGRDEAAQSERATYICWYEWCARSGEAHRKRRAAEMAAEAAHVRSTLPRSERQDLSADALARICARLDDASKRWRGLRVGESLVVDWPEQLR